MSTTETREPATGAHVSVWGDLLGGPRGLADRQFRLRERLIMGYQTLPCELADYLKWPGATYLTSGIHR
jgi:hypothetical protein